MSADLQRKLGFLDALAIVVGMIIGGGIFVVPNLVARSLQSSSAILLLWILAGVVSLFGALACAELGAAIPATGGQYVFLREMYGPMGGFLFGWTMFAVGRTAQVSWLAVTLAFYVSYFIPLGPWESKFLGIAVILALAAVNYRGVSAGALVQKSFTFAKIAGLLIISVTPDISQPDLYALNRPASLTFLDENDQPAGMRGAMLGQRLTLGEMPPYLPAAFIAAVHPYVYLVTGTMIPTSFWIALPWPMLAPSTILTACW